MVLTRVHDEYDIFFLIYAARHRLSQVAVRDSWWKDRLLNYDLVSKSMANYLDSQNSPFHRPWPARHTSGPEDPHGIVVVNDGNGERRFFDGPVENGHAEFEVSGDGRREADRVTAVTVVRDTQVDDATAMITKLGHHRIASALPVRWKVVARGWE